MEISIAEQTVVFLKAILLGAALAVVYDLIRVRRVHSRAKRIKTAAYDFLFCVISAVSLFFFVVFASNGEARGYIALGAIMGAALYFMTLSRFILTAGFTLAGLCSKITGFIKKIFIKFFKTIKKYFNFLKK
ncbi:MAG: spore cortex biosynthesis protein YabQ [Bacillota bacterium]|nr:spore cortex biosynthesis protein YabQ [Bacillota bacterium]